MVAEVKPIRTEADHDAAIEDVTPLWGAAGGTPRATASLCSPQQA